MSNPPDDLSPEELSKLMDDVMEFARQLSLTDEASGNEDISNTGTDSQDQAKTRPLFGGRLPCIPFTFRAPTSHVGGITEVFHGNNSDGGEAAANTMDPVARIGIANDTELDTSVFDQEFLEAMRGLTMEEFEDLSNAWRKRHGPHG